MDSEPKRGWVSRNGLWAIPLGCLGLLLGCGGCLTAVVMVVFGALKSSSPYQDALTAAQAKPEARALLGEPIEAGFLVTGSVRLNNNDGQADLTIPVSGPKGSAKIHVIGEKINGTWTYPKMELTSDTSPDRIDLRPGQGK